MRRITKKVLELLDRKQKWELVGIMIMMFGAAILESLGVSLIMPLVSSVVSESTWNSTWYGSMICSILGIQTQKAYIQALLILLIIIFVVKNVYLLFEYYVQYSYTSRNRYNMQQQLMNRYLYKPYIFYLNSNSGEIMRVLNNDTSMASTLVINLLLFYMEVIIGVVLAVTIFLISPMIASVLGAVLLVELLLITQIMKPAMRRISKKWLNERTAVNKWILQSIKGIKSIKVSCTEQFFEQQYNEHALEGVEAERKNQTLSKMPQFFIEAVTVATVLCTVLVMIMHGVELTSIIPALSAFAVAAMRLLPSVNRISTAMNNVIYNEAALDSVLKNLKETDEFSYDLPKISEDVKTEITFKSTVCLKDINFSYAGRNESILQNANMEIHKGQSIGIIGASGAGKTTAIDIMLGLLKPQSGQVLVDGINIEENMESWLEHLAYIPQQIFLMDDSIKANVAFGKDKSEVDEKRIWEALREAQLENFVKSLPDGINTTIGEAGVRLSGGQRQRIGIARALYNNPDILFFDEATSALDGETESAIMEAINQLRGSKTLIIIAHRLTTIEKCDLIYKVEDGKIERA